MSADPHLAVAIVDYDPAWLDRFAALSAELAETLGALYPRFVAIEHVGSTAVPGMVAKPIIDVMVTYRDLPELEHILNPLVELGYEYIQKPEFTESYFFRRGDHLANIVHLHITTTASDFGQHMLRFRDALRASQRLADDYAVLKRQLADQFPNDRPAYTAAKTPFVIRALGLEAPP